MKCNLVQVSSLLENNINMTKFGQGYSYIISSPSLISVNNNNPVVFIHIVIIVFHML